jgi:hypothetical protein
VVGIVVGIVAAVATYGLALIPLAIGLVAWAWYHRTRPTFRARHLIQQAQHLAADQALPLVHQVMALDPQGKTTLEACGDWFAGQQCWQDASDAYGDYLRVGSDWDVEGSYAKSLIAAGHCDEGIARLDQLRTMTWLNDESRATLISVLALAWVHKGDLQQARAVIDSDGLQRHNLGVGLQQCLAMRAACSYLQGQRTKAIADMDRLYAVNPAYPSVAETKSEMAAGTFRLDDPKSFLDWYPTASPTPASTGQTPAETQLSHGLHSPPEVSAKAGEDEFDLSRAADGTAP